MVGSDVEDVSPPERPTTQRMTPRPVLLAGA
jgi:hypothetical protein